FARAEIFRRLRKNRPYSAARLRGIVFLKPFKLMISASFGAFRGNSEMLAVPGGELHGVVRFEKHAANSRHAHIFLFRRRASRRLHYHAANKTRGKGCRCYRQSERRHFSYPPIRASSQR